MRIYTILLSLFIVHNAMATIPVDQMVSVCAPYPEIKTSPTPSQFNNTNNLARSPESAFYQAAGEKITIYGRLMDANCVPISDGKIYIWQNNSKGYIQYPTSSGGKAKWVDPNFAGTGITNSDNLGRFNFITIIPGSRNKITPYINIKIEHPVLKSFSSKIYFPAEGATYFHDDVVIKNKEKLAKVSAVPGAKDANGNVIEYFIDITLNQAIYGKEY